MLDYLGGIFGGGGGGPRPLTPQYADQGGGGGGLQGLGNLFQGGLNSPGSAALLGAGGALLQSADQGEGFGAGLRAGFGGGLGGFVGARNAQNARQKEEEREKLIRSLIDRFGSLSQSVGQTPQAPVAGSPGPGLLAGIPSAGGASGSSIDPTNPLFTGLF